MSSAHEDLAKGKPRYWGVETGIVVDNVDPKGLYRIRASIEGICEKTAWAFPVGVGGGTTPDATGQPTPRSGQMVVPPIGAQVAIQFLGGDIERPIYQLGWPKLPDTGSEMPTEAAAVSPEDVPLIQTIHESGRIKIWVDERPGKEQVGIQDKLDGTTTSIQIDLVNGAVRINGTAAVTVNAVGRVDITGAEVYVAGRLVVPNGKPI